MDTKNQLISGFDLLENGKIEEALKISLNIILGEPNNEVAYFLAGNCHEESDNIKESITNYRKCLELNPSWKDVMPYLAKALHKTGHTQEAIQIYERLWNIDRSNTSILVTISEMLQTLHLWKEAEQTLQLAIKINPKNADAYVQLANINRLGYQDLESAIGHCLTAIEIDPHNFCAYSLMGFGYLRAGNPKAASSTFERALILSNHRSIAVHSNLLMTQHYLDDLSPHELFSNHQEWQRCYENEFKSKSRFQFENIQATDKKLRIGFTSSDLKQHSVFNFLHGLFKSYDRKSFEFVCFSKLHPSAEDNASEILKSYSDEWHIIHDLQANKACKKIRECNIDILIDLSGHTAGNSLPVYLSRAAPIQVTWLGYPDTTGLDNMDFRLVDSITDPEPWADELASENLYRLPPPFLCYHPHEDWCEIPSPESHSDKIVFGTFNEAAKYSPSTLRLWSKILKSIPNAELAIKSRQTGQEKVKTAVIQKLIEHGIDEERITIFEYASSTKDHLNTYNKMDVALDPFPYNGTTTSCEALWMGVPMITRAGDRHCARVGMSLMNSIGLNDWIAHSDEEYREKAVWIAQNPEQLKKVKRTLRHRMQNSPLCDHVGFARKFEFSLREMWKSWCKDKQNPISVSEFKSLSLDQ